MKIERAGSTACGKTHAAFDGQCIPSEPPRFAGLSVALWSKYTRASSPGGYSSLARLVSRAPRPSRRSRGFHHRLLTVLVAFGLALLSACAAESPGGRTESAPSGPVAKGGDDRTGEYDAVPGWWKPAPDHVEPWVWGQVSGVAVDTPDRVIVGIWGDRDGEGREREGSTNYVVAVDRDGNITENWAQWDSIFNKPHQLYISPYDPERHVWIVERGGGKNVNMQILKFSNDGSELVMQLVDPDHPKTRAEARANPHPGPYEYGDPAVMAFLPDGDFLVGDGYWHSRIIKYNAEGQYLMEWGELGSGPANSTWCTVSRWTGTAASTWATAPTIASRSSPRTATTSTSGPTSPTRSASSSTRAMPSG